MAGGGTIFVNVIPAVDTPCWPTLEGDEKTGVQIVAKALEEPIRQIAANAGLDGSVILEKVTHLRQERLSASTPTRRSTAT